MATVTPAGTADGSPDLLTVAAKSTQAYEKSIVLAGQKLEQSKRVITEENSKLTFLMNLKRMWSFGDYSLAYNVPLNLELSLYMNSIIFDPAHPQRTLVMQLLNEKKDKVDILMQEAQSKITDANMKMQIDTTFLTTVMNNKDAYNQISASVTRTESESNKKLVESL